MTQEIPLTSAQLRSFAYGASPSNPPPVGRVDLAEEFHEASKIHINYPARMFGPSGQLFLAEPEAAFRLGRKTLAHTGAAVYLKRPGQVNIDLAEVVRRRRSSLPERPAPLSLDKLGAVLALSAAASETNPDLRVYPSAGALYPLDVVAFVSRVDGLEPGAYVYDPIEHVLLWRGETTADDLHELSKLHTPTPAAAATFAIAATFARNRAKYGLRGYRFTLIEAGHLAHAMLTAATALGLASLPWGGFADVEVDTALDLDGLERSCLYLVSIAGTQVGE
jgi:SagB-type dehydrogenase family enzyme